MTKIKAFAAQDAESTLGPWNLERRVPGPKDIQIDILYCGVCHSDLHQIRNEWGNSIFPMVPGHEIVGRISKVGSEVKKFRVGELAGVGCLVDSCRSCENCKEGLEQYCQKCGTGTYNGKDRVSGGHTFGGYSSHVVV